ncbi:Glyoxylate pathway regulator [Wickerhamomyces ciferrii]|uniref:Glyoxylate pathway regulator n=1 Tax=Wickerhamomyces ciferrii (strain ATCC 14091 / BCRC 22168 / CBS 111 / JCM 3599 / NBRC 0793 / NRRL Y-1031 F-60-10) TaxID=1206466 RepID=K0KVL7_WICCF|nr:Glyoxylate pathway regulator [Wickerhamomyces ciferrii]CCH45519.1 Glyoxylate pathway regulator [Wickerhamomyces ciferrii]
MATLPDDLEKQTISHVSNNGDISSTDEPKGYSVNGGSTIHRITTSNDGDLVYLGNQAFHKSELMNAFAGDLNPGLHASPHRPMGNPVPLGLAGFAICCFVVSIVNCGARSTSNVKLIGGAALFFGGIIELIAGLWCLVIENTFAATALGSYGGFWLGFGSILIDLGGITSSYEDETEYANVLAFYLSAWVIFSFLMWICTFKSTWPFFILFLLVWVFLMFLAIGYFINSSGCLKAGGVLGLMASFNAFFIIFAGVADKTNSYITVRATPMPGAPTV